VGGALVEEEGCEGRRGAQQILEVLMLLLMMLEGNVVGEEALSICKVAGVTLAGGGPALHLQRGRADETRQLERREKQRALCLKGLISLRVGLRKGSICASCKALCLSNLPCGGDIGGYLTAG
jgi:hypothetical protein